MTLVLSWVAVFFICKTAAKLTFGMSGIGLFFQFFLGIVGARCNFILTGACVKRDKNSERHRGEE